MNYIFYYIATLIPLTLIDMLWILVLAKKFYAEQMGFLFSKSINVVPIVLFYPLYALGILLLVVMPAVSTSSWIESLWRGALLGLMAYGAYDLTNHATIAGWPVSMTLVDMTWGMTVTAITGVISYLIITSFK